SGNEIAEQPLHGKTRSNAYYPQPCYEWCNLYPHLTERHDSDKGNDQKFNDPDDEGVDRLVKCLLSQPAIHDITDPPGNEHTNPHEDNGGEDLNAMLHKIGNY